MKIENWIILNKRILGEVYGNPNFPNGCYIHTSTVVNYYEDDGVYYVVTASGSVYGLGKPDRYATKEAIDLSLLNTIEGIDTLKGQE